MILKSDENQRWYFSIKLSGLSNIFLYAGKDRFDNFSKVVKS